jgi:bifunctional non-homologous end joining protein LigD
MSLQEYHNKRDFVETPEPGGNIEHWKETKKHKGRNKHRRNSGSLRFVVQKHDATKVHYDFRLETRDGILKSWAVPKGMSLDPRVKRLAVLTEDHPLDYLLFEGVIPEGNYGAGSVIVWDTGTYTKYAATGSTNTGEEADQDISKNFQNGKITINLFGQKLKGRFSLIRTHMENQWLMIKGNDEFASESEDLITSRPESVLSGRKNQELENIKKIEKDDSRRKSNTKAIRKSLSDTLGKGSLPRKGEEQFPAKVRPMLARLIDRPFDSQEWVFEVKWDGVRAFLFLDKTKGLVRLQSRSGNEITHRYPEIIDSAKRNIKGKKNVIVDGEIVVLDEEGHPDFQNHQKRMNVDSNKDIQVLSEQIPATYYLFDVLYVDGQSIQSLPFVDRRKILSDIVTPNGRIRISDYIEQSGIDVFEKIKKMNLEGIIAKRKSSIYMQGTRSPDWLKIKTIKTQDCVVIGYTRGEGNRERYFGSLLLAIYDDELGGELRFVGHTGSGFDFDLLDKVYKRLEKLKVYGCPIKYVPYTNRDPVWIKPESVVEVKFHSWTKDKIMRAPIFLRFREDKLPTECRIESEKQLKDVIGNSAATYISDHAHKPLAKTTKAEQLKGAHVSDNLQSFSNLDKVFWSKTNECRALTKEDLIDYYSKMSEFILPHLKDRPISLSRYPDGINGKHFYHKNWDKEKPSYVETVKIYSQTRGGIINYIVCNNKETLLWLANLGCIEMHPWFSRINDFDACKNATGLHEDKCGLNFPDFIIFDLDPYLYSGQEKRGEEPEYNIKAFKMTVSVAYHLKGLLDELKIASYVKTSGKTGLHIFLPITPSYTYDQTRRFAEVLGKVLVSRYTNKITMEWNTKKRIGKVFFDHNQNSKGKTIASIFSVRPVSSATVSMPIRWEQLSSIKPTDFNILNVPVIVRKTRDPWKDVLEEKQDINRILEGIKQIQ